MTYATRNLVGSATDTAATTRTFPTKARPKTLVAVGAAPLYAQLTPMAVHATTGKWAVWANAGSNNLNIISGFLLEATQTDATNEVLAVMILAGKIHFSDIPIPSGETEANLKTALRAVTTREKGFDIEGLDLVQ